MRNMCKVCNVLYNYRSTPGKFMRSLEKMTSEKMTSEEIFNYVRKLELENAVLKTALSEYQEEEERQKHLFESVFGFFPTSPEQPTEKITPESISEKKSEEKLNGIIICY